MKVLYVDQTGALGGGEIAILPWICHARAGASVILFEDGPFREMLEECAVPVEILTIDNLRGIRRESDIGALLRIVPAFLRLRTRLAAKASNFDIVYANSQKAFLVAALSRQKGQPLVWHLRDILTAEHFSPVLRRIAVTFGNRFATVVITNSQATADAFVAAGGKRSKVRVVYDGVSSEPFDRVDPAEVQALRRELGGESVALVGHFSRISHWKGQHILLEAIRELPDVHAVLVGDALFGELDYAEKVRALASVPELRGRVRFLGFRRDIPALMKSMDLVVHTSTAPEPFGLVIVEGMLANRPIIATAAGGALEILGCGSEGNLGLLTAPGSVDGLRSAIRWLLDHPEEGEQLATHARKRAFEKFSLKQLFSALTSVLKGVAK